MTTTQSGLRATSPPLTAQRERVPAWVRKAELLVPAPGVLLAGFVAAAALIFAGMVVRGDWFRPLAIAPLLVLAGMFLPLRHFLVLCIAVTLGGVLVAHLRGRPLMELGVVAPMGAVMVLMAAVSRNRTWLGLSSFRTPRMLLELRNRLLQVGQLPQLPEQWGAEAVIKSAQGVGFSGDFVVARLADDREVLEVVLVDVSGKGHSAGTRSLQLSGALGGLMGAVAPEKFLDAANSYLLRREWDWGFASAVHLAVELSTGHYRLASAGHPPALHRESATASWWPLLGESGPVLGVLEEAKFPAITGVLEPGSALVLYTDGVIESRTDQLDEGISWALDLADSMGPELTELADRLCELGRSGAADDRGAIAIWRR